jgi:hypothetical protein
MNSYKDKTRHFKNLINGEEMEIKVKKLEFKNTEAACQALDEGLRAEWEDERSDMNYYSKQSEGQ